jgi:hypothetical protein
MFIPETTIAYIAGIIDADGYISITRSRHGKIHVLRPPGWHLRNSSRAA